MATLTIRNLDDDLHRLLRVRAAENGRSMEAEVRALLEEVLAPRDPDAISWVDRVRERFTEIDPDLAEEWHAQLRRPRGDWAVSPDEVSTVAR